MSRAVGTNRAGSFELFLAIIISVAGLAIIVSMQMRSSRNIQTQLVRNFSLSATYANEIALVHAYVLNIQSGVDPCPQPNVGCVKNFGSRNFWAPVRDSMYALLKESGKFIASWLLPTEALAADNDRRTRESQTNIAGGASNSETGATGAFGVTGRSRTTLKITAPDTRGRTYCSVFLLPDNKTERQLCFQEDVPPPSGDLKLNGSDGPLNSLAPGTSVTLSWTSSYADACSVKVNEVDFFGQARERNLGAGLSGNVSEVLAGERTTYNYTLTCRKGNRTGTDTVQGLTTANPIRITFTVNGQTGPVVLEKGSRAAVSWVATNADRCVFSFPPSSPGDTSSGASGNFTSIALEANQSHRASLTCTNQLGETASAAPIDVLVYQKIPMYRAYNPVADCHFFTTNLDEYNQRTNADGYLPEGIRYFVFDGMWRNGVAAIERIYLNNGCHYYTTNALERAEVVNSGTGRFEKIEGYALTFADPAVSGVAEISHLYNNRRGDHLFTAHALEKDSISNVFPGIWDTHFRLGFGIVAPLATIQEPRGIAQYRLRNGNQNNLHFWTNSCGEAKQAVTRYGWTSEGTGFYLWQNPIAGVAHPVYRLSHPNGNHMYTLNREEKDALVGSGWVNEGVTGYGVPAGLSPTGNALVPIYRFSHRITGDHLFTPNRAEIIDPSTNRPRFAEWVDEGIMAYGPPAGDGACSISPPSAPISITLLANGSSAPPAQVKGSNFVITWMAENATSCSLRSSLGVISTDSSNSAGLIVSNVLQDERLDLSCSSDTSASSKSVTLRVREPIPVYLNSPRCETGQAAFESDTPQTYRGCDVSFRDDCAIGKDGAQWGYNTRGDADKADIDRMSKNMILEARLGTCVMTSCTSMGGFDQGNYRCDGRARVIRFR